MICCQIGNCLSALLHDARTIFVEAAGELSPLYCTAFEPCERVVGECAMSRATRRHACSGLAAFCEAARFNTRDENLPEMEAAVGVLLRALREDC